MKCIFALMLLFSGESFARPMMAPKQPCELSPLHTDVMFAPTELLPLMNRLKKTKPAVDATFKFTFMTLQGEQSALASCSGFFTSNEGHYNSALHCFSDCLLEKGYLKVVDYIMVRTDKPYPVVCNFMKDDKMVTAKIFASGECTPLGPKCSGKNDFVYGQIENTKSSCVKIRDNPIPIPNEEIISLGYPKKTMGRFKNSNGVNQHFSQGLVMGPNILPPDVCLTPVANQNGKTEMQEVKMFIKPPADVQRMSADLTYGSSGGPIVDMNGQVIGIATNIAGPDTLFRLYGMKNLDLECLGSTYFNPFHKIIEQARTKMSEEEFKKSTDCNQQ